jgi:hypothetical protein
MPAFSTNVDGECAVHVSGFDADTGPVDADADADAGADADGYFCPSKQSKDRKTIFRRQMLSRTKATLSIPPSTLLLALRAIFYFEKGI